MVCAALSVGHTALAAILRTPQISKDIKGPACESFHTIPIPPHLHSVPRHNALQHTVVDAHYTAAAAASCAAGLALMDEKREEEFVGGGEADDFFGSGEEDYQEELGQPRTMAERYDSMRPNCPHRTLFRIGR